jgi:hypothetical protein
MSHAVDMKYVSRRANGRWRVRIKQADGRRLNVGTFDALPDALAARDAALAGFHGKDSVEPGKLEDTHDGNERYVSYVSPDVRTLDDLIAACEIDTAEWHIYKWVANKWPVGAKLAKRDLTWEHGQITRGQISDTGTLTVAPLFQVKAWMVRRVPVAVFPPIQPVSINIQLPTRAPGTRQAVSRALYASDAQIGFRRNVCTGTLEPFHDNRALDVVRQIAQSNHFDRVIVGGDWLDLSEWTDKYLREPEFLFTSQPAVIAGAWWLAQLALATPNADHDFLLGNHELRMATALMTHLMAAYGLKPANEMQLSPPMSVERMLGLPELGYQCSAEYPNGEVWLNDELRCIHGEIARGEPGHTAAAVAAKADVSTLFGHIHRLERTTRTRYRAGKHRTITASSAGCLCRLDGKVPGHRQDQHWQQGFAVVTYTEDGYHATELIEIHNGRAAYNGVLYQGTDPTQEMREQTGWQF